MLECEVANPMAEGKWLKDGNPVDFSDNVRSEQDGAVRRLVIVITRPQDIGEYTYQVANSKTSANLRVEGTFGAFMTLSSIVSSFMKAVVTQLTPDVLCHSRENQKDFEEPDSHRDTRSRVQS